MEENSILILGDSKMGIEIANWIAETREEDSPKIYFASSNIQFDENFKKVNSKITNLGQVDKKESENLAKKYSNRNNFLVTCYWPWILPRESFSEYYGRTLNFHPALLPIDKGWYPHVHQIRNNSASGVTLHQLSGAADSGDIWVQRQIDLPFPITAGDARDLLSEQIIDLFKENWWKIFNSKINPVPQKGDGNYLKKSDVEKLNTLDLNERLTLEELIRAIACRNIGKKSFFHIDGTYGTKFVHITFSEEGSAK